MSIQRLPSLPIYQGEVDSGLLAAENWWEENEAAVAEQVKDMTPGVEPAIVSDWQKNAFKVSGLLAILKRISVQVKGNESLASYQERVGQLMGKVKAQDTALKDILSRMERDESGGAASPLKKAIELKTSNV